MSPFFLPDARDLLKRLPKLLYGEIRVGVAEQKFEKMLQWTNQKPMIAY
jgi:hypothetical protein